MALIARPAGSAGVLEQPVIADPFVASVVGDTLITAPTEPLVPAAPAKLSDGTEAPTLGLWVCGRFEDDQLPSPEPKGLGLHPKSARSIIPPKNRPIERLVISTPFQMLALREVSDSLDEQMNLIDDSSQNRESLNQLS